MAFVADLKLRQRRCYQKKRKLGGGSLECLPFLTQLFGKFLFSVADFLRLMRRVLFAV